MCGNQPEPWEALAPEVLHAYWQTAIELWAQSYRHDAWFYGAAEMPNWLGYSLGYQIVGRYLAHNTDHTAGSLAGAEARLFREYCHED